MLLPGFVPLWSLPLSPCGNTLMPHSKITCISCFKQLSPKPSNTLWLVGSIAFLALHDMPQPEKFIDNNVMDDDGTYYLP